MGSSKKDPLRVLYARGKRARWWRLLETSPRLKARAVRLYRPGALQAPPLGRLLAAARSFRPHVVLAEYSGIRHLPLLPLCSWFKLPLVIAVKGDPWREAEDRLAQGDGRLFAILNRGSSSLLLRRAALRLPLTAALERSMHERLGGRFPRRGTNGKLPSRVVPIPFREPECTEAPPAPGRFILTVTNFRFRSKIDPLFSAASALRPVLDELDLEWRILGDGPLLASSRERLAVHGPRIRCLGFQPTGPHYRAARLFLYPTGLDGLPNALMEAALHRLPIVVNRDSPAAELLADDLTGLVVDFGDRPQADTVMRNLLADAERRRRLGDAAEAWVRDAFAPAKVSRELEAALALVARGRA